MKKSPWNAKIAIMRMKVKTNSIPFFKLALLSQGAKLRKGKEAKDRLTKDPALSSMLHGAGLKREMLIVKSSLSRTSILRKPALATEPCLTYLRKMPLS